MRYWLMKSEPDEASIDDALAAKGKTVAWTGVRNYQARNFMRDDMRIGDGVLFYHSSCAEPGIVGLARVASEIKPDTLEKITQPISLGDALVWAPKILAGEVRGRLVVDVKS